MEKIIWHYDFSCDTAYLAKMGYFDHYMKEINVLHGGVMKYCDAMIKFLMTPHEKYLHVYEMPLDRLELFKDEPFQSILYKAYVNKDLFYQRHADKWTKY